MADVYDIGDQVRVSTTFTNLAGVATNPTRVVCRVKAPSGKLTTYESTIGHPSTGVYTLDITLLEAGMYGYKFDGTGALTASGQGTIQVRSSLA